MRALLLGVLLGAGCATATPRAQPARPTTGLGECDDYLATYRQVLACEGLSPEDAEHMNQAFAAELTRMWDELAQPSMRAHWQRECRQNELAARGALRQLGCGMTL